MTNIIKKKCVVHVVKPWQEKSYRDQGKPNNYYSRSKSGDTPVATEAGRTQGGGGTARPRTGPSPGIDRPAEAYIGRNSPSPSRIRK